MMSGRGPRALAALVLAACAVTALVVGTLDDPSRTTSEPRPLVSSPRVMASSDAGQPSVAAPTSGEGNSQPSDPEVAAARAITAWQQQDTAARAGGLASTATPAYQLAAADIEPSRVPTSPLASTSLRVEADGQALVDALLEDDTALVALLVQVEDAWLLDDLQPSDDVDAAGTP